MTTDHVHGGSIPSWGILQLFFDNFLAFLVAGLAQRQEASRLEREQCGFESLTRHYEP